MEEGKIDGEIEDWKRLRVSSVSDKVSLSKDLASLLDQSGRQRV